MEDHEMFRLGLQSIIDGAEGFSVVGGSDSVMKASADIHKCKPDIVLCDLQLRGESGLRLIQTLRKMGPLPLIAVLTSHDDPRLVAQCKKEGANAFIRKDQPVMEVLEQLGRLEPGGWIQPAFQRQGDVPKSAKGKRSEFAALSALSPRELDCLKWLATDLKEEEVAERLHISVHTLKNHRKSIYKKLGFESKVALVRFCEVNGLRASIS